MSSSPSSSGHHPRVCFINPYSYPLFDTGCTTAFGGSETRIALLAKELAGRKRLEVSVLVFDHGQPHDQLLDGVHVVSWSGRQLPLSEDTDTAHAAKESRPRFSIASLINKGKLLRNLSRRDRLLWVKGFPVIGSALVDLYQRFWYEPFVVAARLGEHIIERPNLATLQAIDAAIYAGVGANYITAEVAYFCKKNNKKFLFIAGSDMDFNLDLLKNPQHDDPYGTPGYLLNYTIQNADFHIVQTEAQQQMLKAYYGIDSEVVPNPIDLEQKYPKNPAVKSILWIGKSQEQVKRPACFLELARRFPQYSCVMVLNQGIEDEHRENLLQAAQLPNLQVLEYVPFAEIERLFAEAMLLVNTSSIEGFPNTFLQAAKYGVPILSLKVDPAEMCSKGNCGIACNDDFELFAQELTRLMEDDALYQQKSASAVDYVRRNHDKFKIVEQIESLLLAID